MTRLREYGVPKKDFSFVEVHEQCGGRKKKQRWKVWRTALSWLKLPRGKILAFLEVGWGRELRGDWQDALFLLLIRIEHREMGVVGETGMKSQKRTGRRFLHAGEVGLRK